LLVDHGHNVVETSLKIEYPQLMYPGLARELLFNPMTAPDTLVPDHHSIRT
jgi:hypothetical protein